MLCKEFNIMKDVNTVQGKETMERFKMEAANEVGVNLKNGYNGDLTSREAGSVGGQMVKVMCPEQQWNFSRNNVHMTGHRHDIVLSAEIIV